MSRYFLYRFSDGHEKWMNPIEAREYVAKNNVEIERDGYRKYATASRVKKAKDRDGFQSGYNPALGEYVRGPRHHSQLLKEKGLVEMGKEKRDIERTIDDKYTDEDLRGISEIVGGLTDGEAKEIQDAT